MRTRLLRLVGLPWAVALGVWFSGCGATTPLNENQLAEAKASAQRDANRWEQRLVKGDGDPWIDYGPVTVGGRSLIVRRHPLQHYRPMANGAEEALPDAYYEGAPVNGTLKRWDGDPYELIDADTEKSILSMDFWHIMAVPGKAVYVRTPEERLANRPSLKGSKSRDRGDKPWHILDVQTGELRPSDVYFVGSMNPEREEKTVGRDYDPLVDPVALHRVDPGSAVGQPLTEIEILPPPKSVLERTVTSRVVGRPHARLNRTAGRFDVLERLEEDGSPSIRLLADGITTWLDTPGESRLFNSYWIDPDPERKETGELKYLGLRSPGTTEVDDLWLLLDEYGRFGAPEGVVGFRPLCTFSFESTGVWHSTHRWILRFAEPQADGAVWEMRGPAMEELANQQRYLDFAVFQGLHWDTVGLDENHKIEESPYLAVRELDGQWLTRRLGNPPPGKRKYDSVLSTTDSLELAKAEVTRTALAREAGHEDYVRRKLERKRERDFENALYGRDWRRAMQLSYGRGGDAMYRVGTSMPRPPADFLRSAASVATEDQAMELRALAVAEEERYAAEVAAHRAQQLEQQRIQEETRRQQVSRSRSTGYSAPRSYLAPAPSGPSYEAQQRYKRNSSYSPHARNMGWQSPYDFD